MNTKDPRHPEFPGSPDDSGIESEAREWALQEQALREVRRGLAAVDGDPLLAHYREVARALREPTSGPPEDFAVALAARIGRRSPDPGFGQAWLVGLWAALAVAAVAVAAVYGDEWIAGFSGVGALLPAAAWRWSACVLACLGATGLLQLMQQAGRGMPARRH